MIIHCEDEFTPGQYVNEPLGVIYIKDEGYIRMPPFQVLEEVTKADYIQYVEETYGKGFLPSPDLETYRFYRISVD